MKAQKHHTYTVLATWYASMQDRNGGHIPAFRSEMAYFGSSEARAAQHFVRACREQRHDSLAYSVTLKRGLDVLAVVRPL